MIRTGPSSVSHYVARNIIRQSLFEAGASGGAEHPGRPTAGRVSSRSETARAALVYPPSDDYTCIPLIEFFTFWRRRSPAVLPAGDGRLTALKLPPLSLTDYGFIDFFLKYDTLKIHMSIKLWG